MCVCVCVFWIYEYFAFFLLRDVVENLKYWLDLWLSSLLIAFISLCFSSFWKTVFYKVRQLLDRSSTTFYLSSPLDFLSRQKLSHTLSIEVSGLCLDSFSIHRETFCLANRSSTDSRSIKVGFCSMAALQLLDLLRPSYMHYFLHVLHLSIILSSIASYFITFMHLYRFLVPSWSS